MGTGRYQAAVAPSIEEILTRREGEHILSAPKE